MIQFGSDKIKEIYVGSDKIKEVYHGSDLVWSGKKPSYAILTNGTRVNFELGNTPMSNFEVDSRSVTLNGTSYLKYLIKEITFEISYENVTSIGNNFLNGFSSLLSIDLSVFVNVTSIGDYFMRDCGIIKTIDLSAFTNVTSIGDYFMIYCIDFETIDLSAFTNVTSIGDYFIAECWKLSTLIIGSTVPPTLGSAAIGGCPIQNIYVPAQSVNAYKAATNWNVYASKISAIW